MAGTTIDALVDRSTPNNAGAGGILVASGTSPASITSALVGTGQVLAHAMDTRIRAKGALVKIVAQAVGATNVAQRAVAGGQRNGSVKRIIDAVTGRHALLVGLKVANGAAVNHGAGRAAVAGGAVALSNEAAIGLGDIVAGSRGVDAGAGVGQARRGDLACRTAVGTAKGRGAVAGDGGAASGGGDASATIKAGVVGHKLSRNGCTASGL